MFDHVGLTVADLDTSRRFYVKALEPLGFRILLTIGAEVTGGSVHVGFGAGQPQFWLSAGSPVTRPPLHIAFVAQHRAAVDAFYHAALAAGGLDNGPPGLRPQYHANYYGAFIFDPDGHNIEAVCHDPAG